MKINPKQVVIINGNGGTGKDTLCEFCSEFTKVLNISSVDKIKTAAQVLGWNGGKTEEDRLFLADLKFLSSKYNDNPYNYIKSKIEYFKDHPLFRLMFIHIREPLEIERVKKDFDCKTLLIQNPNVADIKSNDADANVYNYTYDYVIKNNGTLIDLKNKAYDFVCEVNCEET